MLIFSNVRTHRPYFIISSSLGSFSRTSKYVCEFTNHAFAVHRNFFHSERFRTVLSNCNRRTRVYLQHSTFVPCSANMSFVKNYRIVVKYRGLNPLDGSALSARYYYYRRHLCAVRSALHSTFRLMRFKVGLLCTVMR